jgi:quercetin dioxygenase-like cupin family protein
MTSPFRRVITGHDQDGKAVVISDGAPPLVHTSPIDPGFASADIFRTDETPARVLARTPETTEGPRRQLPTKNGTVLRVTRFPPESDFIRNMTPETARMVFGVLGNEEASTFGRGGRHPMMHRTQTVDYVVVLEGEITMVLDLEDVVLRAGDVAVQCGSNHAWSNRSDKVAVVLFVLIDGEYEPALQQALG